MLNNQETDLDVIDRLFQDALEYDGDLDAFFTEKSVQDKAVTTKVRQLLSASRRTQSVFDTVSSSRKILIQNLLKHSLPPLEPGTTLGAFEINKMVGQGGVCRVYEARRADGRFEQRVAVKVFEHASLDRDGVNKFSVERRLLAQLDHPNIVGIIDGGELKSGEPWLAMEFVEGQPITEASRDLTPVLDSFDAVLGAAAHAHARRVVHQDIKPGNVLLTDRGRVRLLDFGIAAMVGGDDKTRDRVMAMTPEYAAPEQLAGRAISVQTDIFQLGGLLRQMITGATPREDTDAALQPEIAAIIDKATAINPDDRYMSVDEMRQELKAFKTGYPVASYRNDGIYRFRKNVARNRVLVGAGALLATSLIVGTVAATNFALREQAAREDAELARTAAETAQAEAEYSYEQVHQVASTSRGANIVYQRLFADPQLDQGQVEAAMMRAIEGVMAQGRAKEDQEKVLAAMTRLFMNRNDYRKTIELGERFLTLPDRDPVMDDVVMGSLARAYKDTGETDKAIEILRRRDAFFRSTFRNNTLTHVPVVSVLAIASGQAEDIEHALSVIDAVLEIQEPFLAEGVPPEQLYLAYLYNEQAVLNRARRDYDAMLAAMTRSYNLVSRDENTLGTNADTFILNLANVEVLLFENYDRGKTLLDEAEALIRIRKGESERSAMLAEIRAYLAMVDGDDSSVDIFCATNAVMVERFVGSMTTSSLHCQTLRAETRARAGQIEEAKTVLAAAEQTLIKDDRLSDVAINTLRLASAQIDAYSGKPDALEAAINSVEAARKSSLSDLARIRRIKAANFD